MRMGLAMKTGSWDGLALRATAAAALVGLSAGSAVAATNPDADEILQAMSKYLAGTKAFSVSAVIGNEVVTVDGQKLQFIASATAQIERPSHAYIARRGRFADAEIFYDGKTLTLYGKSANAYAQKDVAGTFDSALNALERGLGINLPGGDLLIADPYATLASNVTSSGYYGIESVAGVKCHHLAFRTPQVDWQLWVKEGNEPLPMKYVITTKWTTAAPQYSVQFSDWNTRPVIAPGRFTFVAPKDAVRLTDVAVDDMGEILPPQEGSK
jgi:hypothetical protein